MLTLSELKILETVEDIGRCPRHFLDRMTIRTQDSLSGESYLVPRLRKVTFDIGVINWSRTTKDSPQYSDSIFDHHPQEPFLDMILSRRQTCPAGTGVSELLPLTSMTLFARSPCKRYTLVDELGFTLDKLLDVEGLDV